MSGNIFGKGNVDVSDLNNVRYGYCSSLEAWVGNGSAPLGSKVIMGKLNDEPAISIIRGDGVGGTSTRWDICLRQNISTTNPVTTNDLEVEISDESTTTATPIPVFQIRAPIGAFREMQRPVFLVYRQGMGQIGSGTTITYNREYINIGNHVNIGTGVFTSPVTGWYFLQLTVYPYKTNYTGTNQYFSAYAHINGNITEIRNFMGQHYALGGGSGNRIGPTMVAQLCRYLPAGDNADWRITAGDAVLNNTNGENAWFCGWLISGAL